MSVVLSGRNKHSYLFPFGTNEMIGWATVTLPRYHGYHPCCYRSCPHARTRLTRGGEEARKLGRFTIMAEKEQSKFPVPAYTVSEGKQGKKRKTVFEKAMTKKSLDKSTSQTSQYSVVLIRANSAFIIEALTCKTPYML